MSIGTGYLRKAHFLGAKIRALRKGHRLTLDDLSLRCMQVDRKTAPSVSYLSMIETGKRMPSEKLLALLAEVLQKDPGWFLDDSPQRTMVAAGKTSGGVAGIPLEPGFLFSREQLRTALPELLSQTGTSGRQFASLLIRSYQEARHNRFPDLERAAEEIGGKQFPLGVDELLAIAQKLNLKIKWFSRRPFMARDDAGLEIKTLFRSFFEPPGTIYLNRELEDQPARLKYDLACHIGHKVLHDGDGLRSCQVTAGQLGASPRPETDPREIEERDVLFAWRDFECTFFAGALLCPKLPFRQFLIRTAYSVNAGDQVGLTPSLIMRRMTAVSPYLHWHYFDAYPPGKLRAVYRGNGIPLPWGNMRMVSDPCRQWAVFRMLKRQTSKPYAQISVLQKQDEARLYACESLRTKDSAGNTHVICAGIDLSPALQSQGYDTAGIVEMIGAACRNQNGSAMIPEEARRKILSSLKILNIGWVEQGLDEPASIICPRSTSCPRPQPCAGRPKQQQRPWLDEIREEIISECEN
ncbi:MAG: DUF3612 domain-containing protein [Proteobacteria bacterium]|nr:DUF3612 domain-containing protein [Pseudomonadota bacterium]